MKKVLFSLLVLALLATETLQAAGNGAKTDSHPLCFTAVGGSAMVRFVIKNATHTIQYSTDSTTWKTYTSGTRVTISADGKVYFRAESNQTEAVPFGSKAFNACSFFQISTAIDATVQASGNLMSLYGPDCPDLPLKPYAFASLFNSCKHLTTAPELPATTLDTACYYCLFAGCENLAEAPALPAITIGCGSYAYMFYNCTSMTTAPELPAATLDKYSYNGMFCDCTHLTEPPVLPATEMASGCYYLMFEGCSALRTPPELPATTLADSCYWGMFRKCTRLIALPQLPATTLTTDCYSKMFYWCTSLKVNTEAPGRPWSIPATQLVANGLDSMFYRTRGSMRLTPEVNTVYYVASDTSTVGIVPACEDNTVVYVREGCLCVNGSEGESVRVYDVAGRLLLTDRSTADMKLRLPASGVYLVQVGDRPARRVTMQKRN